MNFEENTKQDVWSRLGPVKFLLGKQGVDSIVESCVMLWPHARFQASVTAEYRDAIVTELSNQVSSQKYGAILSMLLVGVVSAVVQVLLQWWLNKEYRVPFAAWTLRLRDLEVSR